MATRGYQEETSSDRRNSDSIRFALIIDNCGEAKLEEDDTRILNEQAKCLYEVLEESGFCVLYLNNLSSAAIDNFLHTFTNDVDHSQLSMFFLIFLSKGKTPQLYANSDEVIPIGEIFQYFYDNQSPLSRIPKIFFFDIACLDDENKGQPTLPDYPKNSLALAIAHNDPDFSLAVETLSQCFNHRSVQDLFKTIQEMSGLDTNSKNGNIDSELIIIESKNVCLGDHLLLLRSLWYPIRSDTVDVILKNKDEVMSIVRNERIARIAASTASIVIGGSLVITGIALAPFTFGASIGVSIAGGAVGALASAGSIGAFMHSKVLANKQLKKAQNHIALDQQLSLTINNVARMHEQKVRATSLSQIAGEAAAGGAMGIARIGAGVAIAAEGTVEGAALALRTGGRIAGMVLAGVSLAVTVPMDIASIAYHSYNIHKSNNDRTGKTESNEVVQWLISQAEGLLKGMCSEINVDKHEIVGGKVAKDEYGYKISVPVAPVESSSITVRTLFSGPTAIPEGYTLVSAMYDITLPELQEPVTISLEHCVDVTDMSVAKNLCFATATLDIENKALYFSPVNHGLFKPGETFGSITQNKSSFLCILLFSQSLQDFSTKYAASVMQMKNYWNHEVIFSKDLKAHIKYSQQKLSIINCNHHKFRFSGSDGDVPVMKLSKCCGPIEAKGWNITPVGKIPETISKKEIDTLEQQPKVWKLQDEIFPTIRFHTGYDEKEDSPEELNHHLPIDGIDPDRPIALKRQEEAD